MTSCKTWHCRKFGLARRECCCPASADECMCCSRMRKLIDIEVPESWGPLREPTLRGCALGRKAVQRFEHDMAPASGSPSFFCL